MPSARPYIPYLDGRDDAARAVESLLHATEGELAALYGSGGFASVLAERLRTRRDALTDAYTAIITKSAR